MSPPPRRPIGIFDSGIGGWSVLREIRRELPHESLIYLADSAYAPYGERSEQEIAARAAIIAHWLVAAGVKAIVIACNTATAASVALLRARFELPIIAMEPAVKPAAALTRSGVVGVLATRHTVDSAQLARLRDLHGRDVRILACAAAGLVECIEAGDFDGEHLHALLKAYVTPLCAEGADVLVLGCTHYPLIRAQIERVAGPACTVLDPAPAVAREQRRRRDTTDLLASAAKPGLQVFTTGEIARMQRLLGLLGEAGVTPRALDLDTSLPSPTVPRDASPV